MGYSLLCGRNASWIGTFLYSNQSLRQFDLTFFNELAVLDDVDGYIRVDIPQNIKVYVDILIYLKMSFLPIFSLLTFLIIATEQSSLSR